MNSIPVPAKDGMPAVGDFLVLHAEGKCWTGRCKSVKIGEDGRFRVKTGEGEFLCARLETDRASRGVYKGVACECLVFDQVPKKLALHRSLWRLVAKGKVELVSQGMHVSMKFLLGKDGFQLYQEASKDDMEWQVICDEIGYE